MKEKNFTINRREFLQTSAIAAGALAVAPLPTACTTASQKEVNRSNFGGVQFGAITYSFRSMPTDPGNVLLYSLTCGLGSLELMSDVSETYVGAPRRPQMPGGGQPRTAPGQQPQPQPQLTAAQQRERDEAQAAAAEATRIYNEELAAFRRSPATIAKYEELGRLYKMAGIDVHTLKFNPNANSTDADLDYFFNACKAIGARGISTELNLQTAERVNPFAVKHGLYLIFHQHQQFAQDGLDAYEAFLKFENVRFNFDSGWFFASTGRNPIEIVEKYRERITSMHVKDFTGPKDGRTGTQTPWGEGEAPLKEFLLYIQSNAGKPGWPVHCDVELEYPIPAGSNAVIETKRCVDWARNVLVKK